MKKLTHLLVVSVFAFSGILCLLKAFGFVWRWGSFPVTHFQHELDLLSGVAYLLASVGVYRFARRVRVFAIVLGALNMLVAVIGLFAGPSLVAAIWLAIWLPTMLWLFSPQARGQFESARAASEAA